MSDQVDTDKLEAIAVEVAGEGARAIRAAAGIADAVGTKSSPTDVVTDLDLVVEKAIREALTLHTPDASILGEEHDETVGESAIGWVVDPIDGTVNLTYDLPVIGVSIAATVAGDVVAGAVADVLRDEVFSAAAGAGARRDGSTIRPSGTTNLAEALVATGFGYAAEFRASQAEDLRKVLPAVGDIRCFGSAALHLCWVACGRVDAYYQRDLRLWDYAAGALIAREAGARVELPDPAGSDLVLAASPQIFEPLRLLVS